MKKKPPLPVCLHFVIEEACEDAPPTEGSCYDNGLLQAVKHVAQENEAPQAGTNWKSLQEGAHEGEVSVDRVDHTPTGDRERSKLSGSEGKKYYFSVPVSIWLISVPPTRNFCPSTAYRAKCTIMQRLAVHTSLRLVTAFSMSTLLGGWSARERICVGSPMSSFFVFSTGCSMLRRCTGTE